MRPCKTCHRRFFHKNLPLSRAVTGRSFFTSVFSTFAAYQLFTISFIILTAGCAFAHPQFRQSFSFGLQTSTTKQQSPLPVEQKSLFASRALFEGDIAHSRDDPLKLIAEIERLKNKNASSADENEDEEEMYNFASVREQSERWSARQVPYLFHPSVTADFQKRIMNATKYIMARTCVELVPFNQNKHDSFFTVYEVPDHGCYSTIGKTNNSYMVFQKECADGNIIHELMHVLGFYHEQSRTDRDQFVTIEYDNIDPEETRQFLKYSENELDDLGHQYDYGSIMHYQRNAFALYDNLTTIKPNRPGVHIGQRIGLSPLDVRKLRRLFNCTVSTCKPKQFLCADKFECIPDIQRCDGQTQCADASDEKSCGVSCKPNCVLKLTYRKQFMCANKCIPQAWLCDGQSDCADGADERPSNCPTTCLPGYFPCKPGKSSTVKTCLPLWRRCDKHIDCPGGDDENSQQCRQSFAAPPTTPSTTKKTTKPNNNITPYAVETTADPCLIPRYYYNPLYYSYCYYNYRARQTAQQYGTMRAYYSLGPPDDGGYSGLAADPIENLDNAEAINTVCGLPHTAIAKASAGIVALNATYIIDQALCSNLVVFNAAVRDAAYDDIPHDDDDEGSPPAYKIVPKIEFPKYASDFVRTVVALTNARKKEQLRTSKWAERRMEVYVSIDVGTSTFARLLSDMVRFAANVPKSSDLTARALKTKTRRRVARKISARAIPVDNNSTLEEFGEAARKFARSLDVDGIVLDWRSSESELSSPDVIFSVIKQLDVAFHRDPEKGPNKVDLFLGLVFSPTTIERITAKSDTLLRDMINTVDFVMYSDDHQRIFDVVNPLNKLFVTTVLNHTTDANKFLQLNVTQKVFLGLAAGGRGYLLNKNQTKPARFGSKAAGAGFRGGRASSNPGILAYNEICQLFAGTAQSPAAKGKKSAKQEKSKSNFIRQTWPNNLAAANDDAANELVAFQPQRNLISYENGCSYAQKIASFKKHNVLQNTATNKKKQRKYAGIFVEDISLDDTLGKCAAVGLSKSEVEENVHPLLNIVASYAFVQQTVDTCAALA